MKIYFYILFFMFPAFAFAETNYFLALVSGKGRIANNYSDDVWTLASAVAGGAGWHLNDKGNLIRLRAELEVGHLRTSEFHDTATFAGIFASIHHDMFRGCVPFVAGHVGYSLNKLDNLSHNYILMAPTIGVSRKISDNTVIVLNSRYMFADRTKKSSLFTTAFGVVFVF